MPRIEHYEVLVIGSGESGKHLTWNIGASSPPHGGVERKYIGGSCPNIACLPSKNVVRSAKANWSARHGAEYGLQAGPVSTDMRGVNRKRKMVPGGVQLSRSLQGDWSGTDQRRSAVRVAEDGRGEP
jgi:pyruvate/2-oxoglutarate dehydrogenase complex dihydrolipoamide dehydrogenase (E3) component